ncbi:glycoside hydrolase family 3 C-terminal domain-containing protein [Microbacterium sp. STN6]|uniref:glycoside hydrolase family 3 N-terminal domain-containing protein n=1 Tax=Microbacterium sp. STN6 TaxID=2995588 RepID=UPI002260A30C|nr:glycoside hydrolase family 3 N-terminal domain-containing protein [Microbacterium sp. STN6]MCX7523147.1 glycoside hydrolase family 3 C-terminal domain-containing protein [Microbacterium sp. STN6]
MRSGSLRAPLAAVEGLVAAMTVEEKILLLEGVESWNTNAIPRLGIPSLLVTDGPHGVRKVRSNSGAFALTDTEHSTAFPTAATVANSWDPENARLIGRAIGRESTERGVDVLLAPGVNIKRNPLCGRNFEYYSEDPLVSGEFGAAFVSGVESEGVATSVKHLAANSNEDFRFVGDSLVDERALREIYLPAFERVVTRAKPSTVMCAYNAINGTFSSDNRALLTGILREEWGFDGVVVTDWGATHDRVASINAGCELDMPGQVEHNRAQIRAGLLDGRISHDTLDQAVTRVLRLVDRCAGADRPKPSVDEEAHAALARDIAIDAAVLLANDGTLPLDASGSQLLVVGEMFEKMRFQGAGSSLINPPNVVTPRDAFDDRGVSYRYERGYRSLAAEPDADLERAAIRAARRGETALFFGGLGDLEESEGFDRQTMTLGRAQRSLLRGLLDAGARVVLVLFAGAPLEVPFAGELAAVLDMYLPGMRGGDAAAALLFGEANPSGKLTESWTTSADTASSAADYDRDRISQYYESIYVGYRFYDKAATPLQYPFGYGLSYTSFAYSDLRVIVVGERVEASFTVRNTGDRAGAEAVQLYVRNNAGPVFKAEKELRAFDKVRLAPRESRAVTLHFALGDLAYWDIREHGWVLENGEYAVLIAASVADVRLSASFRVTQGRAPASPYSAAVDAAYDMPPAAIPAAFAELLGAPIPRSSRSRRLTLETRLSDARRSLTGRIMHAIVLSRVRKDYAAALAMPDSLERDTRVKNMHFLVRMMPFNSLRSMAMSSGGKLPYAVAAGLADIAAFHPIRGVRRMLAARAAETANGEDS